MSPQLVLAQQLPIVMFINHVRGQECCDAGSLENFQSQIESLVETDLPALFALRYDVLTNPKFLQVIKKYQNQPLIKFGLMLEVTPQLASDSYVEYRGDPDKWFQAQYAFLIGYNQEERVLILKTLLAKYQGIFKSNPEFTTAWQVDTFSLNYLHKNYGLKMHQLAREQWGLDSYTLDGGPPHYPYLASENWAFVPDYSDKKHLLIVRHTIDDPLYSYGDRTSAFTSQPNDYSLDNKDFGYFERLLDQALNQFQQPGYVNLGLENSMAEKYQLEYQKQIAKIADFVSQGRVQVTNDLDLLKSIYQETPITIHAGQDLINNQPEKVYWITTPTYRLRLRFSRHQASISDLRIYHPQLLDPYFEQVATNKGYLIVPYLINAGIHFPDVGVPSWAQRILGIPMVNTVTAEPVQDVVPTDQVLNLPPVSDFNSIKQSSLNSLSYLSAGRTIVLNFSPNQFEISPTSSQDFKFKTGTDVQNPIHFNELTTGGKISWTTNQKEALSTTWKCQSDRCQFTFNCNPQLFSQMIETQYPFIFPEKKARPLNQEKTVVYAHNRYAIAGRNPVRIVLIPQDDHSFPTNSQSEVTVVSNPMADHVRIEKQTTSREYQFVDISQNQPTLMQVKLNLDQLDLADQTIYFAPNCKNQLRYCFTHPRQSWWFIRTLIEDKMRLKLLGEKQD